MKNLSIFLFVLFYSTCLLAQTDTISSPTGDITVSPVLHGSLVLQWKNKTIYVDPYGGVEKFAQYPAPDLVLITDIHGDHLHKETLKALDLSKAELVAPQAVMEQLGDINFKKKHTLANGQQTKLHSLNIEAMPMYNLPDSAGSRHPKGRGNGYVLNLGDKRVYIAGDTEAIPEMRQLQNIDLAFVPMNLPYTMDVDQAADGVLDFKPRMVYPYHFRGAGGAFSDVEKFQVLVNQGDPSIDVRLREWCSQK